MRTPIACLLLSISLATQVQAQTAPLVTVHAEEKTAYVSPFDKKATVPSTPALKPPSYTSLGELTGGLEVPTAKPLPPPVRKTSVHTAPRQARPAIRAPQLEAKPVTPQTVAHASAAPSVANEHPPVAIETNRAPLSGVVVNKVAAPEVVGYAPTLTRTAEAPHISPPPQNTMSSPTTPDQVVTRLSDAPAVPSGNQSAPLEQSVADTAAVAQAPDVAAAIAEKPAPGHAGWQTEAFKAVGNWLSMSTLAFAVFAGLAGLGAVTFLMRTRITRAWQNRDPAMHDPWFSK
jgi:hypothetical protein